MLISCPGAGEMALTSSRGCSDLFCWLRNIRHPRLEIVATVEINCSVWILTGVILAAIQVDDAAEAEGGFPASISEVIVIKNADGTTSELRAACHRTSMFLLGGDSESPPARRDTGEKIFPRIAVMARQYLAIPASSATAERVFSYQCWPHAFRDKSLLDGT